MTIGLRVRVISIIALVLIAPPTPAHADSWNLIVDGECTDADAFRARTETQRVRGGDVSHVSIRVALTARDATWHVAIEVASADRAPITRELDGESCAAVTDAAILIVAQLLDGTARLIAPVERSRGMPALPDEEPARNRPLAEPVSIRIAGSLGADLGSLPAPTAGIRAGLDVGWWRAVLTLGATRWQSVTEVDASGEGLTASAWQARAALRLRVARPVDLGAQFEIGELSATGRGVDTGLSSDGAWQAVGATGRVRLWTRGRLEIGLEIELLVPLGRPTFIVDGEPRYQPGTAFRGFVGVGWRLFDGNHGVWP